jgi:adenosylcobinamide-GDP ribazoletransferase
MFALLAFFTALPVGPSNSSLQAAARKAYLLPLVGLLTALPGAILLLLAHVVPPGVAATLAFVAALLIAGMHHTDGVLDVGDALMLRGSSVRRQAALKDGRVGAGAVGALIVAYAPALAALAALTVVSPAGASLGLVAGETAARSAMLLLLVLGRPYDEDSSCTCFVQALKRPGRRGVALLLALALPPLVALPLGLVPLVLALTAPTMVTLFALDLAKRAFGGINGDITGATGELTRMVLLVALSIAI